MHFCLSLNFNQLFYIHLQLHRILHYNITHKLSNIGIKICVNTPSLKKYIMISKHFILSSLWDHKNYYLREIYFNDWHIGEI